MRTKKPQNNCHDEQNECGYVADERNRYFTGKYMTARDFSDEQSYFLSHHRLHNRLLHGWGIVCGLKVIKHPSRDCAARWVVVQPGIALDCCGRELILKCETAFELPLPRPETNGNDDDGKSPSQDYEQEDQTYANDQEEETETDEHEEIREPFLLVLRYVEEEIERVPALYSEGECDASRKEANRIREKAVLDVVRLDEVEGNCWLNPQGDAEADCRDDCGDDLPGPGRSCLNPVCPCGHVVPLALITPGESPADGFEIDLLGRRYLPTPPEFLTHIVHINWPHGGEVTMDYINNVMKGRLELRFDRKLQPAVGEKTGIGPLTFLAQFGGVQHAIEFLPYDGDKPPTLEEDCVAVFTIDPDYISTRRTRRSTIVENIVYVTLKCDFILDCHNNPVDGNFLRARFPTGDGVPGGVFESWFRVVHDDHHDNRDYRNGDDRNRDYRNGDDRDREYRNGDDRNRDYRNGDDRDREYRNGDDRDRVDRDRGERDRGDRDRGDRYADREARSENREEE